MNREEVIKRLKDIISGLADHVEYEEVKKDVQALKYAINELERTSQEVPVQEQYVTLKIDGSEIGKVALNQIREMQKKSNITIIPV